MGHSCASGLNSNLTWNSLVVVICGAFVSFMSYAVVTVTEFSKYRSIHMIEYFEALRYVRCFFNVFIVALWHVHCNSRWTCDKSSSK